MNPIHDLRKAKGWTQEQMAALMGVKYQQIGYWERHPEIRKLDYANLLKIAKVFGLTYIELLLKCHEERS